LESRNFASGILFNIIWRKKTQSYSTPILSLDPLGVQALIIDQNLNEMNLILRNSLNENQLDFKIINILNQEILNVEYATENDFNAQFHLTDINGHIVLQKQIILLSGNHLESLNLPDRLSNGMYFLSIHSGCYHNTFKVFILK
jgi:hypothetical protein